MKRLFWEAHRTDQWVSAVGTATRPGPGGALRASFTWCELQRSSECKELYTDANATDAADTNNRFAVNVSSRHRVIVSLSQTVISKDCSASFDRVCLAGQPGRSFSRPYWTSSVWPPQQTCQTFRQPGAQARCPRLPMRPPGIGKASAMNGSLCTPHAACTSAPPSGMGHHSPRCAE